VCQYDFANNLSISTVDFGKQEIVVGFRTPAGVVTTVQSFKTIQIPRLVRGKPGAWDPLLCLDWGNRFLTFLKTIFGGSDTSSVCRVKFVPGSGVNVEELGPSELEEVVNGEDRVGFLPSWYWEEVMREGHPTT
jgi:RAT1-interacting protein